MSGKIAALVAFVAGFAVMNTEIAVGRLLAVSYGTSSTTWALLIGTVLSALAAGNLLGGRLCRRGPPERRLVLLFAGAAVLLVLLPRVAPALVGGTLARFRSGEVGALVGAAAAVAGFVALPVVLLGAAAPLLLVAAGGRAQDRLIEALGPLAGRLYAAGTAGSLAGTFGAGLVLLPCIGTRHTLDVGAAALGACAALLAFFRRARVDRAAAAGALALVLGATLAGAGPALRSEHGRVVWSHESRHNHIVVVETAWRRELRLNEGFALQSFRYHDGRLPAESVWAYYALAPAWAQGARPRQVLLLGLGGGTAAELYRRLYPEAAVTGVELDADVVRAGRERLGVDLGGVEVIVEDARTFVALARRQRPHRYDVMIVDAFQFPYVPFQLATREFFAEAADCLAPGGVLMVNAGRYREHREVAHALARTLASVFPHVAEADPPTPSNTILIATGHPLASAVGVGGLDVPAETAAVLRRLAAAHQAPHAATWPEHAPVLTDDHAPIERLTDRIVWRSL